MAYTSEQYKYLLIQRLRRHMAMNNDADRMYTQSFFGHLFDESVTVTEEAYNHFMDLMDKEIQFCAEKNIYLDNDITDAMIEQHGLLLTEAFATVGITLTIAEAYNSSNQQIGGDATFVKPNGEVMVYEVRGGFYASDKNRFRICSHARTEYEYAKASAKYYNFRDKAPLELKDYNPFRAGQNTFWSYDADTLTMTITGNGSYVIAPADPQVGGGPYSNIILGANVAQIEANAFREACIHSIILLHAADAPLKITGDLFGTNKHITTVDVYCDNLSMRAYENTSDYRIIMWHTLDDWGGGEPTKYGKYYGDIYMPPFINGLGTKKYSIISEVSDGVYIATVSASKKTGTVNAETGNVGVKLGNAGILGFGGEEIWTYDSNDDKWYWTCLGKTAKATRKVIWANYDVLDSNGNVVFPSPEPEPVP